MQEHELLYARSVQTFFQEDYRINDFGESEIMFYLYGIYCMGVIVDRNTVPCWELHGFSSRQPFFNQWGVVYRSSLHTMY